MPVFPGVDVPANLLHDKTMQCSEKLQKKMFMTVQIEKDSVSMKGESLCSLKEHGSFRFAKLHLNKLRDFCNIVLGTWIKMEMFSHNQMKKQTQRLSTNTLLAIIRDGGGRSIIFESAVRPILGQLKLKVNRQDNDHKHNSKSTTEWRKNTST